MKTNPALPQTFKDHEPGFVQVDLKDLPRITDAAGLHYLRVAIAQDGLRALPW